MITAAAERHSESLFLVRMSFVELYNNRFRNLLELLARPTQRRK